MGATQCDLPIAAWNVVAALSRWGVDELAFSRIEPLGSRLRRREHGDARDKERCRSKLHLAELRSVVIVGVIRV